ncbi:MAG: hypothetical protein PHV23_01360 [Candidatus Gracilibacteria bacterium]|nr:hypothetical protein [Candidatus Gracilibacteria bacterium]
MIKELLLLKKYEGIKKYFENINKKLFQKEIIEVINVDLNLFFELDKDLNFTSKYEDICFIISIKNHINLFNKGNRNYEIIDDFLNSGNYINLINNINENKILEILFLGKDNILKNKSLKDIQDIFKDEKLVKDSLFKNKFYNSIFQKSFDEGNILKEIQKLSGVGEIMNFLKSFEKVDNKELFTIKDLEYSTGRKISGLFIFKNKENFGNNIFQANYIVKIKFADGENNFFKFYADFNSKMRTDFLNDMSKKHGSKMIKTKNGGYEFNGIPLTDDKGNLTFENELKGFLSQLIG